MKQNLFRSLGHALRGLRLVWREELNFRIQTMAALAVVLFLIAFRFSLLESAIILVTILLVLAAEMFNTLLENVLDVIEPEHHASVGRMKDMMAGVVLLLSIGSCVIGAAVVGYHFL